MRVFIAGVSGETQYVPSLASAFELTREKGDELFIEWKSRGDVAREGMLDTFLKRPEFDAMLLLDLDQKHPKNMLEQLRSHDLDMVTAHAYRRGANPIQSLCYELTGDGSYPYLPYLFPPTEGLHEIAIAGFGCVLIKRHVLEAVQNSLPKGESAFAIGKMVELTGEHDNWGSDFRFFMMARKMGYKLYLDASLESKHATIVWLDHDKAKRLANYQKWADAAHELLMERIQLRGMDIEALKQRRRMLEARLEDAKQKAQPYMHKEDDASQQILAEISLAIYELDGRLKEVGAWIEWFEKYPKIQRPDQLPTTENMPLVDHMEGMSGEELKAERDQMYRSNADELIEMLPAKGQGRP